jgi:hypothetical protein
MSVALSWTSALFAAISTSDIQRVGSSVEARVVARHELIDSSIGQHLTRLTRSAMNTVKIMTLEEGAGVPRRKRQSDCGESSILMLWTGQALWPVEVVIGRTVAVVRGCATHTERPINAVPIPAESDLPGEANLKRSRDGDEDDDLDELGRVRCKFY